MKSYPEIECLKLYFKNYKLKLKKLSISNDEKFILVAFSIDDRSWNVYIDDEYNDYSDDNALMNLFLILSSLEDYNESKDYLTWCKQYGIDASELHWLDYYKSLGVIYAEIKSSLGLINPCISSIDYQLRTGVIKSLISGTY